jgi:hypothetical protein
VYFSWESILGAPISIGLGFSLVVYLEAIIVFITAPGALKSARREMETANGDRVIIIIRQPREVCENRSNYIHESI